MQKTLTFLVIAGLTLSACSSWRDSRANPTNWFGSSQSTPVQTAPAEEVNPLIPASATRSRLFDRPEAEDLSQPLERITELRIEPATSGAIIYVAGIASRQGAYQAELRRLDTPENAEKGILAYSFRVVYPENQTAVGSERTRTINHAASVSRKTLEGIKVIRVEGQTNAQESRRR